MAMERYKVKNIKGLPGLLVGHHVKKPGETFVKEEWIWGEDTFQSAFKAGRFEVLKDEAEELKVETAIDISEMEKMQKKLDKMLEKYSKLNPESKEAKSLLAEITELEGKLK